MRTFTGLLLAALALGACPAPEPLPVEGRVTLSVRSEGFVDPSADEPVVTDFFLVPKSDEAFEQYLGQQREGALTRLTVFESAMNQAPDAGSVDEALIGARQYVDVALPNMRRLLPDHAVFLFPIAKMPPWMSRSEDTGQLPSDEGWRNWHAHPPADWEAWEALVEGVVRMLHEAFGDDVELVFEVWNEPDLYWLGTEAELLELYTHTVRAIHRVDPDLRVGGFGSNQWNGKVAGSTSPMTVALLDHVVENDLPLDFISWHAFADHPATATRASTSLQAELDARGLGDRPQWITEWNNTSTFRGSTYQPASYLAQNLAMRELGLHARFLAAWQDYSEHADGSGYGLHHLDMRDKPVARVHDAMRALQDLPSQELHAEQVVALVGEDGSCREVLLANHLPDPLVEASEFLLDALDGADLASVYDSVEQVVEDLDAGTSRHEPWAEAFAQAAALRETRAAELGQATEVMLVLDGPTSLERASRLDGEAVTDIQVSTQDGGFLLVLDPNAVVSLRACE